MGPHRCPARNGHKWQPPILRVPVRLGRSSPDKSRDGCSQRAVRSHSIPEVAMVTCTFLWSHDPAINP